MKEPLEATNSRMSPQSSSSEFNGQNVRELCLVEEFERTFIDYHKDLIIETGPITEMKQYEFSEFVCPSTCGTQFQDVVELQKHIVFRCAKIDYTKTELAQINELIEEARNDQCRRSFLRKETENRSLVIKCPLTSPLATYLGREEFKVFDSLPPRDKTSVPKIYKAEFREANCTLFFDLTLLASRVSSPEPVKRKKALVINPQFTVLPIPGGPPVLDENNGEAVENNVVADKEDGNPYTNMVFNGLLSHKVKWDRDMNPREVNDLYKANPVAVIIKGKKSTYGKDRLTLVNEFICTLPDDCQEALKASKLGHSELCPYEIPGIPRKKFTAADLDQHGSLNNDDGSKKMWSAQSFFEIRGQKKNYYVLFEGWASLEIRELSELQEKADDEQLQNVLKRSRIRASFLTGVEKCGSEEMKLAARKQRFMEYKNPSQSELFWILEDMSFFHSRLQEQQWLAPIMYISLVEGIQPPCFSFSAINVMSESTYKKWIRSGMNAMGPVGRSSAVKKRMQQGVCEKPNHCHCYTKFQNMLNEGGKDEETQYLQFTADGLLDLSDFDETKKRVIVECSDSCRCSHKCVRRAIQRGQQAPLIVFYENEEQGYSLRAGAGFNKGELIGEVTGRIREKTSEVQRFIFKFLSDDLVLDTEEIGNAFRFLHRSTSSNATLIETYSKRFESDPVVPRIAVYATRDIKFGDKITIP